MNIAKWQTSLIQKYLYAVSATPFTQTDKAFGFPAFWNCNHWVCRVFLLLFFFALSLVLMVSFVFHTSFQFSANFNYHICFQNKNILKKKILSNNVLIYLLFQKIIFFSCYVNFSLFQLFLNFLHFKTRKEKDTSLFILDTFLA